MLSVRVADVTVCIHPLPLERVEIHEAEKAFLVDKEEGDIRLHFRLREFAVGPEWDQVFATPTWGLYRSGERLLLLIRRGLQAPKEWKPLALVVNEAVTEGEMFMSPPDDDSGIPYPLTYPTHELLMAMHLATREGLELHACGVIDSSGEATLFVGTTGAGKSTLCRFARERGHRTILSDDRVVVRKIGKEWRAYGTPWHGDARAYRNTSAPLGKIYLLEQAKKTHVGELARSEAAALLLGDSFPAYWSQGRMNAVLRSLSELTDRVPVFRLRFTRDAGVLDKTLQLP